MKYKCISPFTTDAYDEDHFYTFKEKEIKPGEIYKFEHKSPVDGAMCLNGVNTNNWIEISKEQPKEYFEEIEDDMFRPKAMTCKHSTGHIGTVAVYTLPTCPNMHIIKGKYVTTKTKCKVCRFYKERR